MSTQVSHSLVSAIKAENLRGFVAVIPDIKCFSPKKGDLLCGRDPVQFARNLVELGASALSVVTESEHFDGSSELLRSIASSVNVPILRKDFITNVDQLLETLELGATAVLLISAIMGTKTLELLHNKTLQLGLEPLVEVHTKDEMKFADQLGARLIGINNRDILSLELDDSGPELTAELACLAPADSILISESGILSSKDAMWAADAGANAVLAGTAIWQADNVEETYRSLRVRRTNIATSH